MASMATMFALLAMVSWGLWAVLANQATQSVEPTVAMILSYLTGVFVAAGYVITAGHDVSVTSIGVGYALAAGVFSGIGAVAFYAGLAAGRTATVTTISAPYFVVAAVLGLLVLGESVTWHDTLGIVFAAVAVTLIAY